MAHIGIDARLAYYRQGGIAQTMYRLIEELPAVDQTNRYTIFQSRKDSRNLATGPHQKRAMCWTPAHHRFERLALAIETLPHNLDLFHSPDFIPPIKLGSLSGRCVITIHDLAFLHYPQFLTEESRRYYNDQIEYAVNRADHIIAVSEATRQDVITLLGVQPEKISTVWNGLDKHFSPVNPEQQTPILATYDISAPGYILFVGTIEPRKNVNGLLHAYAQLRQNLAETPPLVIVGRQGWLTEDLHTLSENLGLQGTIQWIENAPYDHLPALYSAAQVLCLPSFYEGFGFTPLEAMACGTPVIVANRASLPEVVGDAGLLTDPDSPEDIAQVLNQVLTDSALAQSLREAGFERIKLFDWATTAQKTLDVYETVLKA